MKRLYFVLIILACSHRIFAQAAGDYVATASMEWNSSNWSISNGSGGYSSTGVAAPTSTKNVFILSGATVTVVTTTAVCNNLTVNSGGILNPTAAITASGATEMDGTLTGGTYTATGAVNVLGTWTLGTLTTNNSLAIGATGVLKGTTTAGGSVQTLNINGTSPTVTIAGQLGGPSKGVSGESIRLYCGGSGTTTFTGTGKFCIARFQPVVGAAGTAQTIVIDIDMNIGNNSNGVTGLTLQTSANTTANKTFIINQGKTVTLSNVNGGFHNVNNAITNAGAFTNMTYTVNGTLDISAGTFVFYTFTSTASPNPTASLILNVGSTGVLKLGANVRLGKLANNQTAAINVASGGVVDCSSAALNLTTTPVSANGTSSADAIWFTLNPGSTFKRLVAAGVATPLWIGPTNTNYNPVTVTPTTASVFTAAVATGNTPTGTLNTNLAINRTWTITPVTPSSTTLTFGYNGTTVGGGDANSGCDPTAAMKLWYNNGTSWSLLTPTAVASAAGSETDHTVTFPGITSFPTFALLNDFTASTNASLSALSTSSGTLSPVFASGTNSYTASVSNATTSITVTPTTSDATATVTVNGTAVTSGSASGSIALVVGTNTITTVVTAQDGATTQTYTLTVTRLSNDATLSNLVIAGGTLSPAFAATTNSYTASVTNNTSSITVTPTLNNIAATVTVNGTTTANGSASTAIPLVVGANTITAVVTAQDGTTTNTYSITVTRAPSADANLSNISLSNGTLNPVFATATNAYTAFVANTVTSITLKPTTEEPNATVVVNGTAVTNGNASGAIALTVGSNTITAIVTAQDGVTTNTYTLMVTRAQSSDATLSAIATSAGTLSPAFSASTNAYSVSVSNSTTFISVTPTANEPNATITVNGVTVASGSTSASIPLSIGANTITTVITAQDGLTTATYTLTITRAQSSNANLSALAISSGTLSPIFASATNSYTASVPNTVSTLTVTPTLTDVTASVTVNGISVNSGSASGNISLNVGANTITTIVTAQNGVTSNTYTITVTRAGSSDAKLSSLTCSGVTLSPVFTAATTAYAGSVVNSITSVTLTPVTEQANASVTINGTTVNSGSASGAQALAVGSNTINVVVTAQDGVTTTTYTATITRAPSSNANLSAIALSTGTLSPVFASATTGYTASVANSVSSITLTPTSIDPTATIKVNGTTVTSGMASLAIALNVGSNTLTTIVTAQDGSTTYTYTVTATRAGSPDANLGNLAIDNGTLTPAFNPATTSYAAGVPNTLNSINVTPTAEESHATIKVNGATVASGSAASITLVTGANTITTVVTAQDGTTKTYTLTVTKTTLSNNANLSSIALSSGIVSPVFSSATTAYTASVTNATTSITVTPTSADATASLTVNGTAVTSGNASTPISLTIGTNTITVAVKAQDGITLKNYTITVTRAQSSNANLASLSLSIGTLSPAFLQSTNSYTTSVSNATTAIALTPTVADANASVKINGTSVISGSASGTIALSVGNNTITTVVTAQDGTLNTYIVTVTRAQSANNSLAGLTLSSGSLSPVFVQTTTGYSASVSNVITSITVTPAAADATATITVNGTPVTSGGASGAIGLSVGNNMVNIIVTAQNGATQTYTVAITRAQSTNNNLAGFTLSSGTLSPVFAQTTGSYFANVSNATTSITVTPTVADATATVTVNGIGVTSGSASGTVALIVGNNIITTIVTAQNGTTQAYTVTVTRAQSSNNNLAGLALSNGTLSPVFASAIASYTATTSNTSITVTPTVADVTATITVNGSGVTSGTPSSALPLAVGNNSITVVVTAQNGAINTYIINLTRLGLSQAISFAALSPITYGSTDVVPGATSTNSTIPITYTSSNTAVATITTGNNIHVVGAGNTIIMASQSGNSSYNAATPVTQTLVVTAAPLTVTATNQTKIYGSVNPPLSATYTGFVNGDSPSALSTAPTLSTTATTASAVNAYPITGGGAVAANYSITYTPGTLTVTPATLTATVVNSTKVYGAANPTFTATYAGFVNGDTPASLTSPPAFSTTATSLSTVGTYPVTASAAASANYNITYVAGSLSISQAILTITAANQLKVYGAANPTLTAIYTGFVNGDTQANLTTQPTLTTTASTTSVLGAYPITVGGASASNYSITYATGALTVTQAPLTIIAANVTKIYGAANPTLTATYTGFVNGDTQANLTTQPTLTTTATTASNAGAYPIIGSGAAAANYAITYTPGTLTVLPATLTITAVNATKVYGVANPSFTATYTGFVNGDTPAKLTTQPTFTTTAVTASPVGTYIITPSGAVSANYTITYGTAALTITPALLTITPNNLSKTYGGALPALTVTYTGFISGDSQASLTSVPTLSTTATTQSPVGTYPITASGASSGNYAIFYATGTLTINKALLTITAVNQTVTLGAPIPTLTLSYTGFVNGDDATTFTTQPSGTTTATSASAVGTYPITVSSAASANYSITYVSGTLSISNARNFLFNAISPHTYGDADFNPGATVDTNEPIIYTSSNTSVATIINGNIHIVGAGSSTITATIASNPIYTNVSPLAQVLTVNKATQTIVFAAIGPLLKGSAPPLITVTSSNGYPIVLSSSDNYVATVSSTGNTGWAISPLHVGTTIITALQAGDTNYLPDLVTQTLVVQDDNNDDVSVNPALSPNGDGVNDYLVIDGIKNYPDNKLTIFNRNGVKVYQKDNYDNINQLFDGHSSITGGMLQYGSYFYLLDYKVNGDTKKKVGYIVLKN